MNKKIILLVAILLIVAVVFVACKGKGDDEKITESTTETTSEFVLHDYSDDNDSPIIPELFDDEMVAGEGDIIFGDEENVQGEDSISWDEMVGN